MFTKESFARLKSMADVYALSPEDFEWFCKFFLEHTGYQQAFVSQKHGELGGDGGIDIHCVHNNQKVLVQCKKWRFGFRGFMKISPVRELGGCMLRDRAPQGIFISTLEYDHYTKSDAAKMNIRLIGPKEIGESMVRINPRFNPSRKLSFLQRIISLIRMVLGMKR